MRTHPSLFLREDDEVQGSVDYIDELAESLVGLPLLAVDGSRNAISEQRTD